MFHEIPEPMRDRMRELETKDSIERKDGTPRLKRLRQITPETGKFLAVMAASAPPGDIIEIGTSAGYSTMWLALGAQASGKKIITFELMEEKVIKAKETFRQTHLESIVDLRAGDALVLLDEVKSCGFCFLDCEKELYFDCYKKVVPKLVSGGLLICDNAINHRETLQPMMDYALKDERVDCVLVPIGYGEFLVRKK